MRKPVFRISNQVRHKPGFAATEYGQRFEISDLERRALDCTKQMRCSAAQLSTGNSCGHVGTVSYLNHTVPAWASLLEAVYEYLVNIFSPLTDKCSS